LLPGQKVDRGRQPLALVSVRREQEKQALLLLMDDMDVHTCCWFK
jgi:hypothetical protein